jgi:hypothetical protein
MVALRILQRTQRVDVAPDRIKVHFMRFKNSYAAAVAAAVAAVVFSAAFQPAEASIIVIDDFTEVQTDTGSGSDAAVAINNDLFTPSFGGFDQRGFLGSYPQSTPRGFRTVSASSSGGQGTLLLSNNGVGSGTTSAAQGSFGPAYNRIDYYNTTSPYTVDLTGQQYAGFWIETLSTSATPTGSFKGFVEVYDIDNGYARYTLPSMWPANTAIGIPFTSFPGVDFEKVTQLTVGIINTTPLAGSTAYNATANFDLIAVPEPTQMVSVAAVGAMFGAWRLRKLRRNGEAAGDVTAG